jgi:hypothetical protein
MRQGGNYIVVDNNKTDIEKARKKDGLYLYVWGAVYYEDGFGSGQRTTKFCHRYNCINLAEIWEPPGMGGAARLKGHEIEAMFARYHRYGNDAD